VATPPSGTVSALPVTVRLRPALSSRIGEVRQYTWDFWPLGSSHEMSPSILYRQLGEYTIRLVVEDARENRYVGDVKFKIPPPLRAEDPPAPPRGFPEAPLVPPALKPRPATRPQDAVDSTGQPAGDGKVTLGEVKVKRFTENQ
jgi:hypothetical protein